MCTYIVKIDDKLVKRAEPIFKDNDAIQEWLQTRIEDMFAQYVIQHTPKKSPDCNLVDRLRGIGHAPKDFDYKKELESRFE